MRTDFKVGIAVGILAVIAVAVYYAVFAPAGSSDANTPGEVAKDGNGDKSGAGPALPAFRTLAAKTDKPADPPPPAIREGAPPKVMDTPAPKIVDTPPAPKIVDSVPDTVVTPTIRETPKPEPVISSTIHEAPAPKIADVPPPAPKIMDTSPVSDTPPAPKIVDTPPAPEPVVAPKIADPPPAPSPVLGSPPTDTVTPTIRETPPAPKAVEPPVTPVIEDTPPIPPKPITPVSPEVKPEPGAASTYEVQKGDTGFWTIAEKKYGDGRLWPLIAKANPSVDSNALRPGLKLTIPPKPGAAPAPVPPVVGVKPEPTSAPAGDASTYTVQKGDAGFWGIAQKLYGNGKYWTVIAAANPKVSSSTLKVGDKLVVPPKSVLPTTAPAGVGTGVITDTVGTGMSGTGVKPEPATKPAAVDVVAPAGHRVYVVQKGDAGFWGIAAKVYGEGKYWPLIAKANPTIMSGSIRAGQQMIYPELTESMKADFGGPKTTTRPAGATSRPSSSSGARTASPKPATPAAPRPPRGGTVEEPARPSFD